MVVLVWVVYVWMGGQGCRVGWCIYFILCFFMLLYIYICIYIYIYISFICFGGITRYGEGWDLASSMDRYPNGELDKDWCGRVCGM